MGSQCTYYIIHSIYSNPPVRIYVNTPTIMGTHIYLYIYKIITYIYIIYSNIFVYNNYVLICIHMYVITKKYIKSLQ